MFFDYYFLLLVVPALFLGFWAQTKVQSTFKKYNKVATLKSASASEAARRILDRAGLQDVPIEMVRGNLTAHYDPKKRVLRLSESVYHNASVASLGIAAHEVGHAIQHAEGYSPLAIRNKIFPVASIGSNLAIPLFFMGILFSVPGLMYAGIIFFAAAFLFQVVTLPVEFNASNRAVVLLGEGGYLTSEELSGTKKVLSAAALTYVAAAVMALAQLLRLILLARGRD